MKLVILLQEGMTMDGIMGMLWPALAIGVMYFFFIRPQQKKRKQAQEFRDSIQKGDSVVTIGGIHGKVAKLGETTVTVATEGGKMVIDRSAISSNSAVDEQVIETNK